MSYNTPEEAFRIVGVTLPQVLLDEAQALIHQNTLWRWEVTSVVDNFSSKDFKVLRDENRFVGFGQRVHNTFPGNELSVFIKMPVITMTSIAIGGTTKTEDTDFELKKDTGEIRFLSFAFIGDDSLTGTDDIVITYTYGYTSTHKFYPIVSGLEARIAMLLNCNPLILAQQNLQGDVTVFSGVLGSPIDKLLKQVPKQVKIRILGK